MAKYVKEWSESVCKDDVLRIMVATDNHLGFGLSDPVRRDDSFITFQEILKLAVDEKVDFLLLGGDLFHDNKPARETLHRTMGLFRHYCFGDDPVVLGIHSDEKKNFQEKSANFLDPNVNISLPVFAIHGNHDDPTGQNSLSALDMLSISKLINYFGKCSDESNIQCHPILMSKGKTKLALYGLGYIRDERLFRRFQEKKVKFFRPRDKADEWFNLFTVHQNRNQHHSPKSNIDEGMLKGFFDLVIWGHEHEQLCEPVNSLQGGFDVIQPGSSIAVSLSPEETKQKKVVLVEIHKKEYRTFPRTLKTVRPFVMSTLDLKDTDVGISDVEGIEEEITKKIEEMLLEADQKKCPDAVLEKYPSLKLPLLRLKVDYSDGYATMNPKKFGLNFQNRVANPKSIVHFFRRKSSHQRTTNEVTDNQVDVTVPDRQTEGITVMNTLSAYLKEKDIELSLFHSLELEESVRNFVEKNEDKALEEIVERSIQKVEEVIKRGLSKDETVTTDKIDELLETYQNEIRKQTELFSPRKNTIASPSSPEKQTSTKERKPRGRKVKAEDTKSKKRKAKSEKPIKRAKYNDSDSSDDEVTQQHRKLSRMSRSKKHIKKMKPNK